MGIRRCVLHRQLSKPCRDRQAPTRDRRGGEYLDLLHRASDARCRVVLRPVGVLAGHSRAAELRSEQGCNGRCFVHVRPFGQLGAAARRVEFRSKCAALG